MNIDIDKFVAQQCSFTKAKAVTILTQTFDDLGAKGAQFDYQLFQKATTNVIGFVILKIQKKRLNSMSESDAKPYVPLGFSKERMHIGDEFILAIAEVFPEGPPSILLIPEIVQTSLYNDPNFRQKIIEYFKDYHHINIETEI